MTEYHDLIREHGLTFAQQNELQDAYDESPAGFARIAKRTLSANNPPAALVACVRKGEHLASNVVPIRPPARYEPEPYDVCDPDVRDHWVPIILAKLGRIGTMPQQQAPPVDDLAARLLATLEAK